MVNGIPIQGDIIKINLNPKKGHEQAGILCVVNRRFEAPWREPLLLNSNINCYNRIFPGQGKSGFATFTFKFVGAAKAFETYFTGSV